MQAVEAERIIEALATGIEPIAGEVLPDDSPFAPLASTMLIFSHL